MKDIRFLALVAVLTLFAWPVHAYDWSVSGAKVTHIEVSYVPDALLFQIDKPVGNCPAGATLSWSVRGADQAAKIANVQAVLTSLLTAFASDKTVSLYGTNANGTNGCSVEFIHLR